MTMYSYFNSIDFRNGVKSFISINLYTLTLFVPHKMRANKWIVVIIRLENDLN